jgi:hypothetical protein
MAQVFQFVATGEDVPHADLSVVGGGVWHVAGPIDNHSLCGTQMDGDDGYMPGPAKSGRVTCWQCREIIAAVKKIRGWE